MRPETLRKILRMYPAITLEGFKAFIGSLSRSEIEAKVTQLEIVGLH